MSFIPNRCAHIDTVGSNVLIRGNMPLVGQNQDQYAYDEIAAASKVDLSQFHLVEIPIIDNVGERPQFEPLMTAFGVDVSKYPPSFWPWWTHPSYDPNELQGEYVTIGRAQHPGSVLWRPFEGLPANVDPATFLGAPGWDYSGFIDNLILMLHTMHQTAFYVHCQLGADRTGAAHIGYLMKSKGLSLEEASSVANTSTSAGAPNSDYQRLVEAYAKVLTTPK